MAVILIMADPPAVTAVQQALDHVSAAVDGPDEIRAYGDLEDAVRILLDRMTLLDVVQP